MNVWNLRAAWEAEEKQSAMTGWDFSHIEGRYEELAPPWDYGAIVRAELRPQWRLLDMGTGGGEFLLTLGHPHERTSVTEAWPPNVRLCMQRLAPLGITVRPSFGDTTLPYEDETFDIIINRHESFDVGEIWRMLAPGGLFITQQVGGENDGALSRLLIPDFVPPFPFHDLKHCRAKLEAIGFDMLRAEESRQRIRFTDVGALVWFACVLPWEFPGFSVASNIPQLLEAQRILENKGEIDGVTHRFLIVARKHAQKAASDIENNQ